jgi:hypothetical protein
VSIDDPERGQLFDFVTDLSSFVTIPAIASRSGSDADDLATAFAPQSDGAWET